MNTPKSFLGHERPLLTVMVQAETPERIKELIDLARPKGADAFGMQLCKLREEFRTPEVYRHLFDYAGDQPVYVTNYRSGVNKGKADDAIAKEMLSIASCGKVLCDVMGDLFDPQPGELTTDPTAVQKQKEYINALHQKGAEVLMSSHVLKFTSPERVLEIARAHEERGADICKIVVGAETPDEEIENLKIIDLLRRELKIPFLFLSGGECYLIRRIGGELGCCMYLCVVEHDEFATKAQPLLDHLATVTGLLSKSGR